MKMAKYKKFMSYRIRHKGKKVSLFDTVARIKKQLKEVLPEIEEHRYSSMLARCRRKYEGSLYHGRRTNNKEEIKKRKKMILTEAEKILYDFLLSNDLNPSTTYRWFLAVRVPQDIKDKLEKGQISQKQAMHISNNRRRVKDSNLGLLMLEDMRIVMRGL